MMAFMSLCEMQNKNNAVHLQLVTFRELFSFDLTEEALSLMIYKEK